MSKGLEKTCEMTQREPDVARIINELDSSITGLENTIKDLTERLVVISNRKNKKEDEADKSCPKEVSRCELSGKIQDLRDRIHGQTNVVRDQIEELEI